MWQKCSTFLRVEVCVNRIEGSGPEQGAQEHWRPLRLQLVPVTDQLPVLKAQSGHCTSTFRCSSRLRMPVTANKIKSPASRFTNTRMMRLMEVLLHGGTAAAQRMAKPPTSIRPSSMTFGLSCQRLYPHPTPAMTFAKMKARMACCSGRIGRSYRYRLSDQGTKAALMFILFHKRVCGPLANSLFHRQPDEALKPSASRVETAYPARQITPSNMSSTCLLPENFAKMISQIGRNEETSPRLPSPLTTCHSPPRPRCARADKAHPLPP